MKISLKANTHRSIDEAFEQFMLEHCKLKNLRPSIEKHYREFVNYSLYKFLDKDSNVSLLTQEVVHNYILWLQKTNHKRHDCKYIY